MASRLKQAERDAIIQALQAGVVPRIGLEHIQVDRSREIQEIQREIARIADGGSGVRFVIGEYGSGKTFLLTVAREVAAAGQLVTTRADLSADRRLYSTSGQARALYCEMMRNLGTRTAPEGGALQGIVERFMSEACSEAREASVDPADIIQRRLATLKDMVGGFDFAEVLAKYWAGHDTGDPAMKTNALRWLRGEYSTRTEARQDLGVRTIPDDDSMYDQLKLLARFFRLAGWKGLLVCLDELASVHALANAQARRGSYDQILRIFNDCIQGIPVALGFLLAGTPESVTDSRRGLFSHEALQSRVSENRFATGQLTDYSGPVIRLESLTQEDLYVLLEKLRDVYVYGDPARRLISDEGLHAFMKHCFDHIGEAYFRTPRSTIREFLSLLAILDQHPDADWAQLVGAVKVGADVAPAQPALDDESGSEDDAKDDGLASFRL